MVMSTLRWVSSGWTGAPGYTTFRFSGSLGDTAMNAAAAASRTFLNALVAQIPAPVRYTVDPTFNEVQESSGIVSNVMSYSTVPADVVGTGASFSPAIAGVCVVWRTSTLRTRRLAMGRTFIVPVYSGIFATNGQMTAASRTAFLNAGLAFMNYVGLGAAGRLTIWKRPSSKGATDGNSAEVTGVMVNPAGAELKTRRAG
jgi:hypothetical protein